MAAAPLLLLAAAVGTTSTTQPPPQPVARIEPGGWGAFLGLARHPSNASIWLAGSDVGGLFVTSDDSKSWAVCNRDLATKWIFQIEFLPDETPLVATTAGVYRGQRSPAAGPCLWDFLPSNAGLGKANYTATMASSRMGFHHPIRRLHAEGGRVWAGVGIAKNRGPQPAVGRAGDPFHVYLSEGGGVSWRGVLALNATQVMSIVSGEIQGCNTVVVTTAVGVFVTVDSGQTWRELGVAQPRETHDAGSSWSHVSHNAACKQGQGCLPINSQQNETHPNTRTAAIVNGLLFLSLWDNSEADVAAGVQCVHTHPDPDLKTFRGGPYVSDDGGVTFRWLFNTSSFKGAELRCPGVSVEYSTTNFPWLAVDPADSSHIFLGGWAAAQGLHELVSSGSWINWNTCPSHIVGELPMGCFEGRRPDSLTHDTNVYVFDFGVDWVRHESRVITNGTVVSTPAEPYQPLVFFTTSRGGLRAAYDLVNSRWSFKHFNNDIVDIDATPPLWNTTGMGDTCVNGAAWATHNRSTHAVLMAVADGGVARTLDGGRSFQQVSEDWWGGLQSDGTAITADGASGCVYAAHYDRGGGAKLSSVFKTCDAGDSWELIGGYGGASSNASDGGLRLAGAIAHIAIDHLSPVAARRLLIGAGVSGGLEEGQVWMYDPHATPTWTSLLTTTGKISWHSQGPHTFTEAPSVALLVAGPAMFVLDLRTLSWATVQLTGHVVPSTLLTAVVANVTMHSDGAHTLSLVLGGRLDYSTGPAIVRATINTHSNHSAAQLVAVFDKLVLPSESHSVAKMTVSALVMHPEQAIIVAGLQVGDYYDGDVPPSLFISRDSGANWEAFGADLPNQVVASMAFAPDGQLCVSSNGDGLLCTTVGTRSKRIPLRTDDDAALNGGPGAVAVARWLSFGLSAVYLAAFASLWCQVPGLFGAEGLLPLTDGYVSLPWLLRRFRDPAVGMEAVCCVGTAVSALGMVSARVRCGPVLGLLWWIYRSVYRCGGDFLGFQWDILLLEAGLLGVLSAPLLPVSPVGPKDAAANLSGEARASMGLWVMQWLFFRLMLASGAVKLIWRDSTWWQLTALAAVAFQVMIQLTGNYGFFNMLALVLCIPMLQDSKGSGETGEKSDGKQTRGWIRSICPSPIGACSVLGGLLAIAFAGFGPGLQRPRFSAPQFQRFTQTAGLVIAFALCGLLQPLWASLSAISAELKAAAQTTSQLPRRIVSIAHTAAVACCSGLMFGASLPVFFEGLNTRGITMPYFLRRITRWLQTNNALASYGLFRSMTGLSGREELVIEAAIDRVGVNWIEIPFRFKPGALGKAPPWSSPHQPRLDWQMWFAALGSGGEWLNNLLRRIVEGSPSVSSLLDTKGMHEAFKGRLPAVLRVSEYRYRFASRAGSDWWVRELVSQTAPLTGVQLGAFQSMPKPAQPLPPPLALARRCVSSIGPVGFVWLMLCIPVLVKATAWAWRRRQQAKPERAQPSQ